MTTTTDHAVDYRAQALSTLGAQRAVIAALPAQFPVNVEVRTYGSGPELNVHLHSPAGLYEAARLAERLGLDDYELEENPGSGLFHHRWYGTVEGVSTRLVWLAS
jgi:hypothetical protein